MLQLILLIAFSGASIYFDLKFGRVPNLLCGAGLATGLALSIATKGLSGLEESIIGSALGFVILIIPFLLHMVGGGDVKFLSAAGAIVGWRALWPSFLLGSFMGGVIALLLMVWKDRSLFPLRKRIVLILNGVWHQPESMKQTTRVPLIPYALPLSLGLLLFNSMYKIVGR
ncbi:MAG: A24 family peptidase [Actinomycetota bacterium]|nr:A24 family peptidase [Actinomycetota bacterium]